MLAVVHCFDCKRPKIREKTSNKCLYHKHLFCWSMILRPRRNIDYVGHKKRVNSQITMDNTKDIRVVQQDQDEEFHDSFSELPPPSNEELKQLQNELDSLQMQVRIERVRKDIEQQKLSLEQMRTPTSKHRPTSKGYDPVDTPISRPTLKDLSQDDELTAALHMLQDCHLQDILPSADPPSQNQSTKHSGKFLAIPEHVIIPKKSSEREIKIGNKLYLKQQMKVEEVSVPQWLSANVRILIKLIDSGDLNNINAIKQYLRYTAKVGDYLQVSDVPAVMLFDENHRKQVHDEGKCWDDIDGDCRYFYLEKEDKSRIASNRFQHHGATYNRRPKQLGPVDAAGQPICISYNKQSGCTRPVCNYGHVCSFPGCYGPHPRFQHDIPPRFRPSTTNPAN
mgnify:CR=1 FL=1